MNNEDGKLDADDHKRVEAWLNEKGAFKPCPACGNETWTLFNYVLSGSTFAPGHIFVPDVSYPMVALSCKRCAYVRLHSAVVIGVVPRAIDTTEGSKRNG